MSLTLNCYVFNDNPRHIFTVHIPSSSNVADLKDAVKVKKRNKFQDLDADTLELWKVSILVDSEFKERISSSIFDPEESLLPMDELSEIFSNSPISKHVHIVVKPPSALEIEVMPDLLHQRKKIYTRKSRPPSEQAKPSEFARTQKDDAFFSCCRPEFKEHRLPLALLHPVFGNFIEDCKSVRLTSKDVVTARNLKTKMCQFYVNEHQRRADLNNILYEYGIPAKAGAIGSTKYETDGHIEHYGRPSLISEVKLEMCGSSNGEPSLQALLYYHCFVRENALWKDMSTSPCFIIFVAGPHIGFGGCALTDRPTMEIFSLLPLDFHSTNGDAYDAIARHLLALKKSVNVLTELYSQMNLSPVGEVIHSIFPYKTGFTHLVDGQLVPFSYDKERTDGRFLFNGKSDCGLVCIKFIPRYGKDVHDWCAKQLIAPKLLGFEVLAGGWVMVVMELLDQSWIPLFKHPGHPNIDNLMEAIRSHVVRLHQNHMVHGDIRDTNIMVKRSGSLEFMLVDFDWAGTAGEVHYPRFLNTDPELGRPADVDAFLPILPSHDILMVGRLIC